MYSKTCFVVSGDWDLGKGFWCHVQASWKASGVFAQTLRGLLKGAVGDPPGVKSVLLGVSIGANLSSSPCVGEYVSTCCGSARLGAFAGTFSSWGHGGLTLCKGEETSSISIWDGVELGKVPLQIDWF